jgi:hypothetical protein
MVKEEFLKSKAFNMFLGIFSGILIVALFIAISKRGYEFGQWLHGILN